MADARPLRGLAMMCDRTVDWLLYRTCACWTSDSRFRAPRSGVPRVFHTIGECGLLTVSGVAIGVSDGSMVIGTGVAGMDEIATGSIGVSRVTSRMSGVIGTLVTTCAGARDFSSRRAFLSLPRSSLASRFSLFCGADSFDRFFDFFFSAFERFCIRKRNSSGVGGTVILVSTFQSSAK